MKKARPENSNMCAPQQGESKRRPHFWVPKTRDCCACVPSVRGPG